MFQKLLQEGVLFDSHCHLHFIEYDKDRDEVVDRTVSNGIKYIVDVGVNYKQSLRAIENSKKYKTVFATVGVHPETCIRGSDLYLENFEDVLEEFEKCRKLAGGGKIPPVPLLDPPFIKDGILMIGETGMDLYWTKKGDLSEREQEESREKQVELFRRHIELSGETGLPLSIHSREACEECLEVLKSPQPPFGKRGKGGVFHSLTPESDDSEDSFYKKINRIIEVGFLIGINGIVTFKNAKLLRNVVLKVLREKIKKEDQQIRPLDIYQAGFVFETDGPWLAPLGKRGERNEPGNVLQIFDFVKANL